LLKKNKFSSLFEEHYEILSTMVLFNLFSRVKLEHQEGGGPTNKIFTSNYGASYPS
jgi:hypothetical protein